MKLSLALIICFELLIAPIMPSLRLLTSEATIAQSNYCPEGQYFDSTRGRCLITQDAAQNLNAMTRCENMPDVESRQKCFQDNAKDGISEVGTSEGNNVMFGMDSIANGVVTGAALAMPMFAVTHGLKNLKGTCTAVSYIALVVAAVSLFAGNLIAELNHAGNLAKIEEEWNSLLSKSEYTTDDSGNIIDENLDDQRQISLSAQKEAFEMLAKAEDSYAQMSEIKAWGLGIAGVAFYTAMTAALLEIFTDPTKGICAPEPEAETKGGASEDTAKPQDPPTNEAVDEKGDFPLRQTDPNTGFAVNHMDKCSSNGCYSTNKVNLERDTIFDILSSSQYDEIESELTMLRNLKNIEDAKDFSSLTTLILQPNLRYSSASINDYNKSKSIFNEMDESDSSFSKQMLKLTKIFILNMNPINSALAGNEFKSGDKYTEIIIKSATTGAGGIIGGLVVGGLSETLSTSMTTPVARSIFAGVLGTWSFVLMGFHIYWMNESKNKAAKIREIKENFDAGGNTLNPCESSDRNNPAKPECYCFTPEGPKNTSRMSSQVCMAYFGSNPNLISDQYGAIANGVNNCIDKNRQPDPKCNCKKSSKGCLVLNPSNANIDLGTFKALGSGFKPLNQSMNGSFNPAKTSLADLQNNAMRMRNLSKKILKSPKYAKIGKNLDAMTKKMEQKILKETSSLKPISQPSSRPIPTDPKAAVAALEKDLKEAKEQFKELQVAPGVNPGGSGGGEKEPGLDFGLSAEDLEAQKGDLAKAMNQKLDYGQNDISASDGNIFQVLSNRYMRSGMRRLFDEEGKLEAEKPAESDINK
jgi:hypothetical protein